MLFLLRHAACPCVWHLIAFFGESAQTGLCAGREGSTSSRGLMTMVLRYCNNNSSKTYDVYQWTLLRSGLTLIATTCGSHFKRCHTDGPPPIGECAHDCLVHHTHLMCAGPKSTGVWGSPDRVSSTTVACQPRTDNLPVISRCSNMLQVRHCESRATPCNRQQSHQCDPQCVYPLITLRYGCHVPSTHHKQLLPHAGHHACRDGRH